MDNNTPNPIDPGKNYGLASLILGIASYSCSCCLCGMGFIVSAIGLALGIVALNKSKSAGQTNGMAIAGIIICATGILTSLISTIVSIVASGAGILAGIAESGYYPEVENFRSFFYF